MKKIFLCILGLSISLLAYNGGTYEGNKKGCALGNAKSCNDLAGMYLSGESHPIRVEEDKNKAAYYYAKSKELYSKYCDGGDGKACFDLAEIYNGMKWNVDQNYTVMLKHLTQSCENGYARGCNEVGAFYKRGYGTKRDKMKSDLYYAKAVQLYEKECDNDIAFSCSNLSMIYRLNMYGTHNKSRSSELEKKSFELYNKLCEKKDDEGCFQMAGYYYSGRMVPIDWKKAKEYYAKSCKYGQDSACWRGRDIDVSKQPEYEKKRIIGRLWTKYAMMKEKERKIREARSTQQMKYINDPQKTMTEKKVRLQEIKVKNILWDKKYKEKIKAIDQAYQDEVKVIKAQTN